MRVTVYKGKASGNIIAPPSKSMAHRLLICAGLCDGISKIHGIEACEDVNATLDCLAAMGAECTVESDTVTVKGLNMTNACPGSTLNCRESGSTLRFFVSIALLCGKNVLLTGSETLLKRPMTVYKTLCQDRGMMYSQDSRCVAVRGPLKSGDYRIAGNISSQFISGLLFSLPLLKKDSTISIIPPIESRSYIDLTLSALALFGVRAVWKNENTIYVPGSQKYLSTETYVEGDYSNAAFFEALNVFGGTVDINGLRKDSLQGDKIYMKHMKSLCTGTPTIHIADCPDLGPVLFSVAAAKYGGVFTGTRRLRIKESDRASAMAEELRKFGTAVTVHDDSVVVYPYKFHAPEENLNSHNDHRVVMALAVLLTLTGGHISDAQAVSKSFPDFFEKLTQLGIKVENDDD